MTLQSCSNSLDEVGAESPSCSTSTSSTEVYSSPLGTNSEILVNDEVQNLVGIFGDFAAENAPRNLIINSEGTRLGNDIHFNVEGDANITVTNVGALGQPIENGLQKEAPTSSRPYDMCNQKPLTGFGLIKKYFKSIVILITIVSIVCAVALITLRFTVRSSSGITWTTTEDPITTTKTKPIHYIFNRSSWGGRHGGAPIPMESPVSLVIIKHTGTTTCRDISSCFTAMQNMQNYDVGDYGLSDIRYNFVVGGDGNIYEGRGWTAQNEQMNNTVDIAFLGDFNVDVPSEFVVATGPWLIQKGIENGYLDVAVKVVCHNQTEDSDSPGENLFKEVVQWKFYSDEDFR